MAPEQATAATPADQPALLHYLKWMQGGKYLERHELAEGSIILRFRRDDSYFGSEELAARIAIGAAFSLLYRFSFPLAVLHLTVKAEPVRLRIDRAAFAAFFGMTDEQMADLARHPDRWEASPIGKADERKQWEFFLKFSRGPAE
jgi:hypothetical protein